MHVLRTKKKVLIKQCAIYNTEVCLWMKNQNVFLLKWKCYIKLITNLSRKTVSPERKRKIIIAILTRKLFQKSNSPFIHLCSIKSRLRHRVLAPPLHVTQNCLDNEKPNVLSINKKYFQEESPSYSQVLTTAPTKKYAYYFIYSYNSYF